MRGDPVVSIVIVSFQTRDLLRSCLRSIFQYPPPGSFEVFVVDNGSTDSSSDMVCQEFPQVNLICNKTNRGFGAASNQAIQKTRGEFVLLLNSDVVVLPNAVDSLVHTLRQYPEAGASGGKLLFLAGAVQPSARRFPTYGSIFFSRGSLLSLLLGVSRRYILPEPMHITSVDALAAAFLLVRRSVMKLIGGFDEQFFLFAEDLDLCRRIKQAGFAILYVPEAQVIHHWGASAALDRRQALRWHHQSIARYFQKHYPGRRWANLSLKIFLWLHLQIQLMLERFRSPVREPARVWRAALEQPSLSSVPAKTIEVDTRPASRA